MFVLEKSNANNMLVKGWESPIVLSLYTQYITTLSMFLEKKNKEKGIAFIAAYGLPGLLWASMEAII